MKNALYLLTSISVMACLFTGCSHHKKMQASKTQINQPQKENIETPQKLNSKNTSNNNNVVAKNTSGKPKPSIPLPTYDTKAYVPLPPTSIEDNFKSKYPSASDVVWVKKMPLVKSKNPNASDYKATFVLSGNNNSVIYSDMGELIETREQLSPDQLSQNIYNAIIKKYPDATIVSASSFKNSKINGSYAAIIKTASQAGELEVILTENGVFVE